jgi:hypothetical protein
MGGLKTEKSTFNFQASLTSLTLTDDFPAQQGKAYNFGFELC